MIPLAVIVHGADAASGRPDECDTLVQVEVVAGALGRLGYGVDAVRIGGDLAGLAEILRWRPAVVVNLVESLAGRDDLAPLVPLLLDAQGLACTGNSGRAMTLTGDKPVAKRLLRSEGLPTPDWSETGIGLDPVATWIVKAAAADASYGLDASCVVGGDAVPGTLARQAMRFGGRWIAERYVEGREVSLALLAGDDGPQALPATEIAFRGFAPEAPRIVDYAAKWEEGSPSARATPRVFAELEPGLHGALEAIARRCWDLFGLAGTARVDFRIDAAGRPWVLEVNANPCLAPDAGFVAAAGRAGIDLDGVVGRLVARALAGPACRAA